MPMHARNALRVLALVVAGLITCLFYSICSDALHPGLRLRSLRSTSPYEKLQELKVIPSIVQASFLAHDLNTYNRLSIKAYAYPTTIVLLNWKRLPNVILLVALYCSEWTPVQKIVVFNNRGERPLTYNDFAGTGCPPSRLQLYNSDRNFLFEARYIACANATTLYCLLQDDDYILHPHIIAAMHAVLEQTLESSPVVILPPDDALQAKYELAVKVESLRVDSAFYWLGYGTLMRKVLAIDFLATMTEENFTPVERQMADNYFSLLSNHQPRVLVANSIGLESGNAFTVGNEGDERNWLHMEKALSRLLSMSTNGPRRLFRNSEMQSSGTDRTFAYARAPCLASACIFVSNVHESPPIEADRECYHTRLQQLQAARRSQLEVGQRSHLLTWAWPSAVDNDVDTVWKSLHGVKADEFVGLDMLYIMGQENRHVELVLLIETSFIHVLRLCDLQVSAEGSDWLGIGMLLTCESTELSDRQNGVLQECKLPVGRGDWRFIRLLARQSVSTNWSIWEIWVRVARRHLDL